MLKFLRSKKIISLICAAALLLTTVSTGLIFNVVAETTENTGIWDGTTATSFAGGTGTEADPYQITNGAQLRSILYSDFSAAANNTRDKYYLIMNDIYLNDVSAGDSWAADTTGLNIWPTGDQFFMGHLDGGSHIVYGLYSNGGGWAGLVPILQAPSGYTTSIKNVGIKYANITAGQAGAIIGKNNSNYGTTIENCFADATVVLEGSAYQGFIAKIDQPNFTIANCYFTGSLTGGAALTNTGALIGMVNTSNASYKAQNIIRDCYTNAATNNNIIGVNATNAANITYEDVYCEINANGTLSGLTQLATTGTTMTGTNAAVYMSGLDFGTIWQTGAEGEYPVLKSFIKETVDEEETTDSKIWDGTTATSFAGGTGTEADPYQITNGAQLRSILYNNSSDAANNTRDKYYLIMNDIYLNDVSAGDSWAADTTGLNSWPAGDQFFMGHLDGGSHIVYGLYSNGGGWAGLVPILQAPSGYTTSIKNVGIKYANITAGQAGAIIGKNNSAYGTTIENCFADATVVLNGSAYQGFIAKIDQPNFIIANCYFTGSLTGGAALTNTGALIGMVNTGNATYKEQNVIRDCYTNAATNNNIIGVNTTNAANITYEDVYCEINANGTLSGLTQLATTETTMKDVGAITNMSGFDYENDYMAVKGGYPVLRSFHNGVWDGTTISVFTNGANTEATPYKITNGAELAAILQGGTNARYYKIMNDIYLNDVTDPDWKTNNPNKWLSNAIFYGNLDGGNHIVYGIYYADDATGFAGLIPILQPTSAGYVKNVGVKDSYIVGERAGGLIGKLNSSLGATVENCFVDETVSLKGINSEGGIISWISGFYNMIVENCYSKATFSGNAINGDGGLLGYVTLTDAQINTMVSENKYIRFINCYAITEGDVPVSFSSTVTSHLFFSDSYGNIGDNTYLPGMTILADLNNFYGRNAYSKMIFFDFTNFVPQWNDTPVLRGFYDFTEYDVNADGEKNANDTVLLIKYLLNLDDETLDFAAADACSDGKINIVDLVALKNYIASI